MRHTRTRAQDRSTRHTARRVLAALTTAGLATTTAACGLGTAGGRAPAGELAGPLAEVKSLEGTSIGVGSKNFTEQLLLGKMAVILLKSAGADVKDLTNIPGSASARQAQTSGQVQMEWEYTGTAWISYLGETTPIPDERRQWEAVRDRDLKDNSLVWLDPAPMNNTYGFAARSQVAKELGTTKLSDFAKVPKDRLTLCVESEFNSRNDGLQPMLKTYGVPLGSGLPKGNVKILDTGAIYAAIDQGECTFGEVFTTDGRIKALDLTVLEDDKSFFPKYNVSPVINKALLDEAPQLRELFKPVTDKLTDETLIELNAKVDVDGQEPVEVANEWLIKEGFITE
ncbi:MAG: glycine betaine ABC transporter substrate-binding protein [Micrococcales bacterium]|nr:glycine betaine ABC transporter substrate-binding protein [Micrococcales bacterium]